VSSQILLIYHKTHSLNVESTAAVGKLVLREKKCVLNGTIRNYMYITCPMPLHLSHNLSISLSMNYDSCHPSLSESGISVVIFISQDEDILSSLSDFYYPSFGDLWSTHVCSAHSSGSSW
jgi:hypothetical protein